MDLFPLPSRCLASAQFEEWWKHSCWKWKHFYDNELFHFLYRQLGRWTRSLHLQGDMHSTFRHSVIIPKWTGFTSLGIFFFLESERLDSRSCYVSNTHSHTMCLQKMSQWPFFPQSAAFRYNSVGGGVFGTSKRVLTDEKSSPADRTAAYSGSSWTSQLTKSADTVTEMTRSPVGITDSAPIERSDSVTPRCVNQQTFIFFFTKARLEKVWMGRRQRRRGEEKVTVAGSEAPGMSQPGWALAVTGKDDLLSNQPSTGRLQ